MLAAISSAPISALDSGPVESLGLASSTGSGTATGGLTTALPLGGSCTAAGSTTGFFGPDCPGLVYFDGWEDYSTLADYWSPNAYTDISSAAARTGSYGLRIWTRQGNPRLTGYFLSTTTMVAGLAYRSVTLPGATRTILVFHLSGTTQTDVRISTGGILSVTRNGTTLATGSLALVANRWYYLEFKTLCHGSAGAFELRINGVAEVSGTGVNTQGAGSATMNGVSLFDTAENQNEQHMDDFYLMDGSVPGAAFLGSCHVGSLLPTGAGDLTQWTPSAGSNYQNVQDAAPDGDTDYNETGVSGYTDLFTLGTLPTDSVVVGLAAIMNHCASDAGPVQLYTAVKVDGVIETSAAGRTNVGYRSTFSVFESKSRSWSAAVVNALQLGYKIV